MSATKKASIRSFTLVELLIVIAILAILAAAVVIVLNPAELIAQSRDTQRISDINMVKKAVDLFIVDNSTISLGTSQKVYISLPDAAAPACTNNLASLPALPVGWSYNCVTAANLRNINGTGWVPLDFTQVKGGSPIPYLPIDPQNDPTLTRYYQYIPGTNTFELVTLMESERQTKAANADGGTDAGRLEVGSDRSLWTTASSIKGYWNFDEGTGVTINSPIGSMTGTITGTTWVAGKSGTALNYAASATDYVVIPNTLLNGLTDFTVEAWINLNGTGGTRSIVGGSNSLLDNEFMMRASGNKISFHMKGSDYVGTTTSMVAGRWYHYVLTRSGATTRAYLDGRLEISSSTSSAAISVDPGGLVIAQEQDSVGGNFDSAQAWNGKIDEMKFYSRSVSATEALALYNATK